VLKRRRRSFEGRIYTGEEAQRIVSRIRAFTAESTRPVEALSQHAGVSIPTAYKWLRGNVGSIRHATVVRVARRMGVPITALWESKLHDTRALDAIYETAWSSYQTADQAEHAAQTLLMALLRHCYGKGWILDYTVTHSIDAYPSSISTEVRRNDESEPCWHFEVTEVSGNMMLYVFVYQGEWTRRDSTLLTRTTFLKLIQHMETGMKSKKQSNGRPARTK
jgi:hypothetical protein